jgi:hypothetical protein
MSDSYRHLRCRAERGVFVLTFLDPLLRVEAMCEASAALSQCGCSFAVLDLGSVRRAVPDRTPPDQEPLLRLLDLRRQLRRQGGRLVLCNLAPEVRELFRVTWLLGLFEVQPDLRDAVAALHAT